MSEAKKRVTKSDEVIDRIIEAVSDGTPLAEVLREDWAPHHSSFYQWLNDDPELDRRFEQARQAGHDLIAANIRHVARGGRGSSKDVKRDRLIVDSDMKLLEKWDRRYGQRIQTAQTDTDGNDVAPALPSTDEATLTGIVIDILGRGLSRMEAAARAGIAPPFTPQQFEYLERLAGPTIEVSATSKLLGPSDGSDLA